MLHLLLVLVSLQFMLNVEAADYTFTIRMPNVHPVKNEQYVDYAKTLPLDQTSYIVSFEPIATMERVHHLIIRGCAQMINIGPSCISGSKIMYAWAKNAPGLKLPPGVGFKVGKDTDVKHIFLQIHYNDVSDMPNGDDSGVILHMTDEIQPKLASVALLYPMGSIPANSIEMFEIACQLQDDVEMHPFAFRTHTHARGVYVDGYVVKEVFPDSMDWQLIGGEDPQLPQYFYPVENENLVAKKGDWLTARCGFRNTENRTIYTGGTSRDEMCNFYIMYYVTDGHFADTLSCFRQVLVYVWRFLDQVELRYSNISTAKYTDFPEAAQISRPVHHTFILRKKNIPFNQLFVFVLRQRT